MIKVYNPKTGRLEELPSGTKATIEQRASMSPSDRAFYDREQERIDQEEKANERKQVNEDAKRQMQAVRIADMERHERRREKAEAEAAKFGPPKWDERRGWIRERVA